MDKFFEVLGIKDRKNSGIACIRVKGCPVLMTVILSGRVPKGTVKIVAGYFLIVHSVGEIVTAARLVHDRDNRLWWLNKTLGLDVM